MRWGVVAGRPSAAAILREITAAEGLVRVNKVLRVDLEISSGWFRAEVSCPFRKERGMDGARRIVAALRLA